jgi:hypothetical protein
VILATRLWAGRPGFDFWKGRILSSPECPDRLWGPPKLLFNGYRVLSSRGKAARCEVSHLLPSNVEVKNV